MRYFMAGLLLVLPTIANGWKVEYKKGAFNKRGAATEIWGAFYGEPYNAGGITYRDRIDIHIRKDSNPKWDMVSISGSTWIGNYQSHQSQVSFKSGKNILFKTPKGIVSLPADVSMNYVTLKNHSKARFINMLKRYNEIQISIPHWLHDRHFVFKINCRGFTKAWRSTGWR